MTTPAKDQSATARTQSAPMPFKQRLYDLIDADDQLVARFETLEDCANARIACNSRSALVAALSIAQQALMEFSSEGYNIQPEILDVIKSALAQASR